MRPVDNLVNGLNRRAFIVAGLSMAVTPLPQLAFANSVPAKASPPTSQWPETDASLAYIKQTGPEIERKTDMSFVAIDGTELKNTDKIEDLKFLYAETKNPLNDAFIEYLQNAKIKLKTTGPIIAHASPFNNTVYLITSPKSDLKSYVYELVPALQSAQPNFSIDKFLGALTADDFVAWCNYHEMRHTTQQLNGIDSQTALSSMVSGDPAVSRASFIQFMQLGNKNEAEADSFAALKFSSDTSASRDMPRRIDALRTIAKLRLLSITSGESDPTHDTYNTLSKTIDLIENVKEEKWSRVQNQFHEMYQSFLPEAGPALINQMAAAATKFIDRQGIGTMSDDQYRDLSAFMGKAYAPGGEGIFAMTMHSLAISSEGDIKEIFDLLPPPTLTGMTYVSIQLRLATDALKDGMVSVPAAKVETPKAKALLLMH